MSAIIRLEERRADRAPRGRHVEHASITDELLQRLVAAGAPCIIRDTKLAGFHVDVAKRSVSFRVQADLPRRARKWGKGGTLTRTVGRWGGELTVRKARATAQGWIGLIKSGTDPCPREDVRPDGATWQDAVALYKERLTNKKRRPRTIEWLDQALKRLPKTWTDMPLDRLGADRLAFAREHRRISRESGEAAADGTMRAVRALWNRARKAWPGIAENPVQAVTFHERVDTSDRGMGLDDLPAWWAKVQTIDDPVEREALLFALLSSLRKNDVLTMRWSDLKVRERKVWIPEPKGGPKRAWHQPCSRAMLRCMWRARRLALAAGRQGERIFPIGDLRKRSTGKTPHDLRRSFATCADQVGVPEETVGFFMNHAPTSVTARYRNRKLSPIHRAAMEQIGRAIIEAMVPDAQSRRGLI